MVRFESALGEWRATDREIFWGIRYRIMSILDNRYLLLFEGCCCESQEIRLAFHGGSRQQSMLDSGSGSLKVTIEDLHGQESVFKRSIDHRNALMDAETQQARFDYIHDVSKRAYTERPACHTRLQVQAS